MNARLSMTVAVVLALVLRADLRTLAQSGPCDPYLQVSPTNPFGYRIRGDRCEGVYVQQVVNTPLLVASFGRLHLPESFTQTRSVVVEWPVARDEVRLRTYTLKPRTYYQMDSLRPVGTSSYPWSTDILAALDLMASDIGIVAWTERNVGRTRRDVYLPVRVGVALAEWDGTYDLLIVPGSELAEVFVGLTLVDADGRPSTSITKSAPLKYGFYPAGRSIQIPVGPIASAGTYILEVGATLKAGGAISQELWFDHVPRGSR